MESMGGLELSSLFEFFETLNARLHLDGSISNNPWNMSLMKRIGGTGTLRIIHEKLIKNKCLRSAKRKASNDHNLGVV